MKEILTQLSEMKDELEEESHLRYEYELQLFQQSSLPGLEIKRDSRVGLREGSSKWSAQVVLLICELLTNGVSPAAIPKTLQTTSAYLSFNVEIGAMLEDCPRV